MSLHGGRGRRRQGGFTLIELMIVVLVIAILSGLAFYGYANFTVKARQSAAQTCLTEAAQAMERFYTTAMTYAGAPDPAGACITELDDFYDIDFVGVPNATEYVLTAVPEGRQADASCGTMTLNQAGATTPAGCW